MQRRIVDEVTDDLLDRRQFERSEGDGAQQALALEPPPQRSQQVRARQFFFAIRGHDEQPVLRCVARQMLEQRDRCRTGPMQVLEHEQRRARRG